MTRVWVVLFSIAVGCGDDDGGADAGADAGTDAPVDVPVVDAPVVDAPVDAPVDSGPAHCGDTLVIAEYEPMVSFTLYNPTSEAIDLTGTPWSVCQRPNYFQLDILEPGVTIPANGSHTFAMPAGFFDQDGDAGELGLYEVGAFANPDTIRDWVCWGTGRPESRRSVAEGAGIWSGDCAPAITGDSLRRIPDTSGTGADSYDPSGTAEALSCP